MRFGFVRKWIPSATHAAARRRQHDATQRSRPPAIPEPAAGASPGAAGGAAAGGHPCPRHRPVHGGPSAIPAARPVGRPGGAAARDVLAGGGGGAGVAGGRLALRPGVAAPRDCASEPGGGGGAQGGARASGGAGAAGAPPAAGAAACCAGANHARPSGARPGGPARRRDVDRVRGRRLRQVAAAQRAAARRNQMGLRDESRPAVQLVRGAAGAVERRDRPADGRARRRRPARPGVLRAAAAPGAAREQEGERGEARPRRRRRL